MDDASVKPSMLLCLSRLLLLTVTLTGIFWAVASRAEEPVMARIQVAIKARLVKGTMAEVPVCRGEATCGMKMLPLVYRGRSYLPFWLDTSLDLHAAKALDRVLYRAAAEGLTPADYHAAEIHGLLARIHERLTAGIQIPAGWWADLELMLSDAFLRYGSHVAIGRVNPETLYPDWKVDPVTVALVPFLAKAAAGGDVEDALNGLRPVHRGYATLREALARYRAIADQGGWPLLAEETILRHGMHDPAVATLRHRLELVGDADPAAEAIDAAFFDDALLAAVRRFQRRHGLDDDGVVGSNTLAQLNVPVEWRVRQLALNLERWRWLPHDLGSRFIRVNTADFNLEAVASGEVAFQMRVVVGRPDRRSPVLSREMTYLEINPFWTIPTVIAVEDMLPEIKKDPAYLIQRGIRVFENWNADALEVEPGSVDWLAFHDGRFPFKLRQDPGPHNSLGHIKFMFANEFAVYLHDTPERTHFERVQRDLSSGCVRVESPLALATFALAGDPRWTPDTLMAWIENGTTATIGLRHPLPVHLMYLTAWTDESGGVHFRRDIYDRDGVLDQALNRPQATSLPAFLNTPPPGWVMAKVPGEAAMDR